MSARFSLNNTSSRSLRGRIPGSLQAVRNSTHNTNVNKKAPTIGIATDNFRLKYGQLLETSLKAIIICVNDQNLDWLMRLTRKRKIKLKYRR